MADKQVHKHQGQIIKWQEDKGLVLLKLKQASRYSSMLVSLKGHAALASVMM